MGAVFTGLGCKRDLFDKGGKKKAILPAEDRSMTELRFRDRRRKRAF